ncbi:hypothetical protein U0070_004913 [Myodes glareolus]|uniref:Secreted protein n=1 Tax=Myodes glareolus TaxID=447135 RepID=A0AAW0K4P0_MYOGA
MTQNPAVYLVEINIFRVWYVFLFSAPLPGATSHQLLHAERIRQGSGARSLQHIKSPRWSHTAHHYTALFNCTCMLSVRKIHACLDRVSLYSLHYHLAPNKLSHIFCKSPRPPPLTAKWLEKNTLQIFSLFPGSLFWPSRVTAHRSGNMVEKEHDTRKPGL